MKIESIWSEQENDVTLQAGLLLRRFDGSVLPDIFVALRKPTKERGLAIRIGSTVKAVIPFQEQLKGLRIEILKDENHEGKNIILIQLSDKQHNDVFSILCEDLIGTVAHLTDENKLVKELLNRFEKWKSLFDRVTIQGLAPGAQRGLYGELFFLRKWLLCFNEFNYCINSWTGPNKDIRDFQFGNWALEVKTTIGNNHQKVTISSERQLDSSNLSSLFLFHLSLESQHANGETLNQIIDSITEILSNNFLANSRFRTKLLEAGYFPNHRILYNDIGYHIRQETIYEVRDGFPRIEERDVRQGVGDVKYSIIVSDYSDYSVNETIVFETINSYFSNE